MLAVRLGQVPALDCFRREWQSNRCNTLTQRAAHNKKLLLRRDRQTANVSGAAAIVTGTSHCANVFGAATTWRHFAIVLPRFARWARGAPVCTLCNAVRRKLIAKRRVASEEFRVPL